MSRTVHPSSGVITTVRRSESTGESFKLSDLQSCRKYVSFLTLVYFLMVLTQVCNLLFMTFADRKPTVKDFCDKQYPEYIASKNCSSNGSCWVFINESKVLCGSSYYDFMPITNDFEVPVEYVKLGTTLQNIGLMIGAVVAGNFADIYGRKKVLFIGTIGMMISLLATSFAPSFIVFTFIRFFDMVFTGGKHCVSNPYFMENLPDKHRMWIATVVTYSPNYIILSGIAYLSNDWKTLSRVAAGLTALPLIMIPYLRDTPRWLIKKGQGKQAAEAAVYIKRWDEKVSPEKAKHIAYIVEKSVEEETEKSSKANRNYYFYHLFTDRKLGSYTIVFAISLFSTSFISYGIAYNMDALAGTVYMNVIILGAARYGINIIAAILEFTIQRVGRRLLHCLSAGFIVFMMGMIFIIYLFAWHQIEEYKAIVKAGGQGDRLIHAIVTFTRYSSLLAAAMCTELFVLNNVQPTELFPTPVRSAGIAFIQTFNRLGTIISPLVFIPSKHWPPAPFLLMFITCLADFLLYIFIVPETRGKKLPDHMPGEETEKEELTTRKPGADLPSLKNIHTIKLDAS
ncbi:major facilitator superfamily transporter [Loa loa]|uniref:Major facilitator superfamily transporter n=1 Tax=Loa loa TaxID=7209 RepID=A0A1I7VRE9_LOALO|nr:major facilitator superfamily transporter [Loa loa]EFO28408.1 major facilitator superfamily transporter [Loa loa]